MSLVGLDPKKNFWMKSKVTGKYHYFYGEDPESVSACGGSSLAMGVDKTTFIPLRKFCCESCRSIWSTVDVNMRKALHNREGREPFYDSQADEEGVH